MAHASAVPAITITATTVIGLDNGPWLVSTRHLDPRSSSLYRAARHGGRGRRKGRRRRRGRGGDEKEGEEEEEEEKKNDDEEEMI